MTQIKSTGTLRASDSISCWCPKKGELPKFAWGYDVYIMMARTQILLEAEMQRRARQRAAELGVSLAEYFRRLVARDLTRPRAKIQVERIFDLGNSGGSDIAKDKDAMTAESLGALHRRGRGR